MSSTTISVHIRRARPTDCDALKRLLKGAQEFDFNDDTTAMGDLKENAFGDWPLVNILVAEDSSGGFGVPCPPLCAGLLPSPPLIGCALYSLVFSTWGGRSMVLDGLHVAPAYRGKGVGSVLLRAVFKEAAQNKCNELTCHALTKSDAFINLMRRHGGMDQEREKGWHLFEMDGRAVTLLTLEQPWTPLKPGASAKEEPS
ncbi:thialysine N-epsilon-acetyltransferase-like [Dermacentor variabilis]|uniref:thialysine N-epsilon-acetyltransferase-like n=1 Tax=Dermacentor variabilis TaxID=34621 RepID=UPI003F5B9587